MKIAVRPLVLWIALLTLIAARIPPVVAQEEEGTPASTSAGEENSGSVSEEPSSSGSGSEPAPAAQPDGGIAATAESDGGSGSEGGTGETTEPSAGSGNDSGAESPSTTNSGSGDDSGTIDPAAQEAGSGTDAGPAGDPSGATGNGGEAGEPTKSPAPTMSEKDVPKVIARMESDEHGSVPGLNQGESSAVKRALEEVPSSGSGTDGVPEASDGAKGETGAKGESGPTGASEKDSTASPTDKGTSQRPEWPSRPVTVGKWFGLFGGTEVDMGPVLMGADPDKLSPLMRERAEEGAAVLKNMGLLEKLPDPRDYNNWHDYLCAQGTSRNEIVPQVTKERGFYDSRAVQNLIDLRYHVAQSYFGAPPDPPQPDNPWKIRPSPGTADAQEAGMEDMRWVLQNESKAMRAAYFAFLPEGVNPSPVNAWSVINAAGGFAPGAMPRGMRPEPTGVGSTGGNRAVATEPLTPEPVGAPASTPVGRRGMQGGTNGRGMSAAGNNPPTVINGRSYTGHSIDRMQEVGLVPSVVENTIQTGTRSAGTQPGTVVYTNPANRLGVVVDQASGRVITVIPR